MIIDLTEWQELVHGAVSVERTGTGGVFFRRHTPEMYRVFQPNPKGDGFWDYMCNCPAGVRIRFKTDAGTMRMKVHFGRPLTKPAGDIMYIGETSVVINGGEPVTFRSPELWFSEFENVHEFSCTLGCKGTEKEVTVYLSNQTPEQVLLLELPDTDTPPAPVPKKEKTILFIGDSITQGYAGTPATCYAVRYANARQAEFYNAGIGGATMQGKAGAAAGSYQWDELMLAFGINDSGWRSTEDFIKEAAEFLESLRIPAGNTVTILTPIYAMDLDKERGERVSTFRKELEKLAEQHRHRGVRLVQGKDLVPHEHRFFVDGLHPNEDGMRLYAENLLAAIRKLEEGNTAS